MKMALVLCSGGIDSITTAYYVKKILKYDKITLLFFNYGQKTIYSERLFCKRTAKKIKARFTEIKLELGDISNSLINKRGKVGEINLSDLRDTRIEGNKWYVPMRNAIFFVYAIALIESLYIKEKKKRDIFVGFKSGIGEGYPDTSIDFIKEIKKIGRFSKIGSFKIVAPFIKKEKEDIIQAGKILGVNFSETYSCYVGKELHCGTCLACRLRQEGFYWANVKDPTLYKQKPSDFRSA